MEFNCLEGMFPFLIIRIDADKQEAANQLNESIQRMGVIMCVTCR